MFDAIDINEVMRQSLQVAVWLQAQMATIEANAWRQLWSSSPWWFQLIMVLNVTAGMYAIVKRLARGVGVRIP